MEICIEAIKSNPNCIIFLDKKYQIEELYLLAVSKNSQVLNLIENQTEQICLTALKTNLFSYGYIKINSLNLDNIIKNIAIFRSCPCHENYMKIKNLMGLDILKF